MASLASGDSAVRTPDNHARAAQAHAVVKLSVAEHYFEAGDSEDARELRTCGFERDAAAGCGG